ncbi:ABC transporter permease [Paractinoplanes atraurantiacus]|uniref:Uncharacterized protein n=1 Tax=Paractinoplanes atraurantiacus TaxID=1036182 RepID=A0A285J0C1_9ACTN|nr:ABC transporter permease [Actinoplanes atraurantiacus]SNY53684.1 hypothetical protein SAMN05421748_114135 [Actinoplanes atraurantiacus]
MTASTLAPSAYPPDVADLIPQARDLAAELGEIPSQNHLKKALRVGTPKARAVLAALTAPPAPAPDKAPADPLDEPAEPAPDPVPVIDLAEVIAAHGIVDEPPADTTEPQAKPVVDPVPTAVTEQQPLTPYARPGTLPKPDVLTEAEIKRGPWPDPNEPVTPTVARRKPVVWPVLLLCLPAFAAIWGGWVEMGRLTGFGMVTLLPGISDFQLNTAITLPIGVETYAAYALYAWLSGRAVGEARTFAKRSAIASLIVGGLGQIVYHLMAAAGWTTAPWPVTAAVACIPVAVLGMGAALAHLMHADH